MRYIILALLAFVFLSFSRKVTPADLKGMTGKWKGELTYVDYGSGKPVRIPVNITVTKNSGREFVFHYQYPKEPHANGYDTLRVSRNGKSFKGLRVISKITDQAGKTIITGEKHGTDNDLPATLRYTYTIAADSFKIKKEVMQAGENGYKLRNEYNFRIDQ